MTRGRDEHPIKVTWSLPEDPLPPEEVQKLLANFVRSLAKAIVRREREEERQRALTEPNGGHDVSTQT